MNIEFSKWLLITDYLFMLALALLSIKYTELASIAIAWTGQLAISTGFYYWKAKNENRIKIPVEILRGLKEEEKSDVDLTQVITSLIDKD